MPKNTICINIITLEGIDKIKAEKKEMTTKQSEEYFSHKRCGLLPERQSFYFAIPHYVLNSHNIDLSKNITCANVVNLALRDTIKANYKDF